MTTHSHAATLPKSLVLALLTFGLGACATSEPDARPDRQGDSMRREEPAHLELRAQAELPPEGSRRVCNISMTECHTRVVPMAGSGTRFDPPTLAGAPCSPGGASCRRVEIEAVGDGDIHWDAEQTLAGVTCSLDAVGLRMEWSEGFYLGHLNDCTNGRSYDFRYVRVKVVGT